MLQSCFDIQYMPVNLLQTGSELIHQVEDLFLVSFRKGWNGAVDWHRYLWWVQSLVERWLISLLGAAVACALVLSVVTKGIAAYIQAASSSFLQMMMMSWYVRIHCITARSHWRWFRLGQNAFQMYFERYSEDIQTCSLGGRKRTHWGLYCKSLRPSRV